MSNPGFRKGRSGGGAGVGAGSGFLGGAPFSQAQILHLMKTEFARARRYGFPVGCIMLQVERLAQLVDMHGAELRDRVHEALGKLVQEKTRGSDQIGVIHDDRYLMVLPHTDLGGAESTAERLLEGFAQLEVTVDGKPLALRLSVGITACDDQDTLFFDTLVSQAEVALQWATDAGGNCVTPFAQARFVGEPPGPETAPPSTPPSRDASAPPKHPLSGPSESDEDPPR